MVRLIALLGRISDDPIFRFRNSIMLNVWSFGENTPIIIIIKKQLVNVRENYRVYDKISDNQ